MPRNRLLLLVALVVIAVLVPASASFAGGGCHDGPSQGTGDTVEMQNACFTPSTLRVEPETTVTFINRDPVDHNVSGMDWGDYDAMGPGERVSVAFDEEGVYAYACTIHPGMTGSVVVGDGDGPGNGAAVVAANDPGPTAPAAAQQPIGGDDGGWLVPATIALVIGTALGFGVATARRRTASVPARAEHVPSAT